jgi:hypothetical protein
MKTGFRKWGILSILSFLFLAALSIASCADLRSEFDPHQWRYQPYRDMPPSWESDMGRPGPEYSGEDMFEDTW